MHNMACTCMTSCVLRNACEPGSNMCTLYHMVDRLISSWQQPLCMLATSDTGHLTSCAGQAENQQDAGEAEELKDAQEAIEAAESTLRS